VPIYMIERNFADQLELSDESVRAVGEVNNREHVSWLMSFLSADRRKSYCLYEADSAEAIIRAARAAGLPADVIVEVSSRVLPDGSLTEVV
jgi:Nickel responsive protein SCO4226-like